MLTASHAQCTSFEFEQVYATRLESHAHANVARCSYTIGSHPNSIFLIGATSSFRFDGIQLFLLTIATISPIATEALRSVGCTVHQCKHYENSQKIRTLLIINIFTISLPVYAENQKMYIATGIASVPIIYGVEDQRETYVYFSRLRSNSIIHDNSSFHLNNLIAFIFLLLFICTITRITHFWRFSK